MKKIIMLVVMAFGLTLGTGTAAYAWHGWDDHGHGQYHESAGHHANYWQQQQRQDFSFSQHGGGHEQARDNAAIHETEKNDPAHTDNPGKN